MVEKLVKGLVLGAIAGVIAYLLTKDIGVTAISAMIMVMSMFVKNKNQQKLEEEVMIKKMMEEIQSKYKCTPVDAGVFAKVVIDGANFQINAYDVEGLGRVSTVQMKRLVGLWEMQSLIINPLEVDMPIYYYNRHREKGNYIYRVELFDTQMNPMELDALQAVVEKYASIPDEPQNERWYDSMKLPVSLVKKVGKKNKEELEPLAWEHFKTYFDKLENASACKEAEKKKKAKVFVDELCKQSGLAVVEIFLGNYGENVVTKLCNEVLFGMK